MNRSECIAVAMKEFGVTKYMAKQLANECEKKKIPYEDGIAYMREAVNEKLWNAILYGGFGERRNTNPASMDRKQFIETVMMVLGISKNFANAYADEFEEHKIPYEKGYESMKAFVSPQMRAVMICAENTLLYGHGDPNKTPNGILSVLQKRRIQGGR